MRLAAMLAPVSVDPARLGGEIRKERERQGLSQTELARRARSHQAVVSKVEQGQHELQFDLLGRLSEALLGPSGLGTLLYRSGHLVLDVPLRDLLASAPELGDQGRDQMVGQYDFWVSRSLETGESGPS